MTLKKHFAQILPLAIIVGGLLAYNFMDAQWTGPPVTAPGNNVKPPINVGTSTDSKQSAKGDLIFDRLVAQRAAWSPLYCNALGGNCILQENLNYLSGDASAEMDTKQVPPGGFLSISCPVYNSTFNPIAVTAMTGGGCKKRNGGGEQISSYPSNWMGTNLPPAWHCQNTSLATTTMTVYVMCLTLYSIPPDFSGGS